MQMLIEWKYALIGEKGLKEVGRGSQHYELKREHKKHSLAVN